jgi:transcriptional regulator with XRE-family HTH domain
VTGYSSELVETADAHFGRRLRALREERGLSQQHVVNALLNHGILNWHQTTVAKIEAGSRPVRLSEAMACASLFGLTVDEMLIDPESTEARARRSQELSTRRNELEVVEQLLSQRLRELDRAQARVEEGSGSPERDLEATIEPSEADGGSGESQVPPPQAPRSLYSKAGPEWGSPAAYGWHPDMSSAAVPPELEDTPPEGGPRG